MKPPPTLLLLGLPVVLVFSPQGGQQAPRLPKGVRAQGGFYVSEKDGMELVRIPAGAFVMGSDHGHPDERPAHKVHVDAFFIDKYEVTNAQFAKFVAASGYKPRGPWRRGAGPGREKHPVTFVTWHDAKAYATWAGRTLPTEAEWERAARGTKAFTYSWGNTFEPGAARVDAKLSAGPSPVGSHASGVSPEGAHDMAGNVWEWVRDWYDRRCYQMRKKPVENPTGPPDGAPPEKRFVDTNTAAGNERSTLKVIRGGGWVRGGRENARCSKRMWGNPRYWFNDTGFRCACR